MTHFHTAYNKIKDVDDNCSGYNQVDSTNPFGFKEHWNLGGDDGHSDFNYWLQYYFSYSNPAVCGPYRSHISLRNLIPREPMINMFYLR